MASQAEQGCARESSQQCLLSGDVLDYTKLLDLPLDVLYNVLSHLHPRDRESIFPRVVNSE